MATLQDTPAANRIHIGIYGRVNSGKSSLLNAIAGQSAAIVSDKPGTTTDPVNKAMEIHGLGPCIITDTAGIDDDGELGRQRIERTLQSMDKIDMAILVCAQEDISLEKKWYDDLVKRNIPVVVVIGKSDIIDNLNEIEKSIEETFGISPVVLSAKNAIGIDELTEEILRKLPKDYDEKSITKDLVAMGDTVLLVMPQDSEAPKGRLILPQVQTIRELIDKKCTVICTSTDRMTESMEALKYPPKLIITDSQDFDKVYGMTPKESMLTSFSVLFAGYKGDIDYYLKSAKYIDTLKSGSRVLIAECCTHAPDGEDIGTVKIPNLLRKQVGADLDISYVRGSDFPEDLTGYDLIIQCGGCMFNRKYIMNRIDRAKCQNVPMTNYGMAIAHMVGIAEKVVHPSL